MFEYNLFQLAIAIYPIPLETARKVVGNVNAVQNSSLLIARSAVTAISAIQTAVLANVISKEQMDITVRPPKAIAPARKTTQDTTAICAPKDITISLIVYVRILTTCYSKLSLHEAN